MIDVPVASGGIRLGQFLKLAAAVDSGADVKALVGEEMVRVNDAVETRRGRQLVTGDVIRVADQSFRVA